MDEAAIDMFLQAHFSGTYTTWQEPCTGYNNVLQTDTWDIFFKCHTCPQVLDSKRFINWNGTKILVHHVSKSASPPCFSCGAKGHLRTVCKVDDTYWQDNYCVTVSAWDIETLPKQASTVTSFKELHSCWVPPDTKRETTPSTRQHEEEGRVGRNDGGSTWQEAKRAEITPNQEASNTPQVRIQRRPQAKETITTEQTSDRSEVDKKPKHLGISIAEEIKNKIRHGTAEMDKCQLLIEQLASERKRKVDPTALKKCLGIQLGQKRQPHTVVEACGLEFVSTPPTGNCQYYAVAMALLNQGYGPDGNTRAVEDLTAKLKQGIKAAAEHCFDKEFPHDIRQTILGILGR
ncbi:hypothetical protein GN244_ATG15206 [Phytophthora infestans]|uniref:CCHC-type domain-containing protein n=1 Tax=Phytophthora infestans TaxID=4787 RepID=A0A833S4P1_PHYIN|nr:hypothetical protein GN244_ATG15206 [Phytophthora infestans]KAF4129849.1 hypothetical protein GN958_ATG20966 [Phytophthora infestans]